MNDKPTVGPDAPAVRIAVFEDSVGHLEGLEAYLERRTNFEVVAKATTPEAAAQVVEDAEVDFDAAVVDLELVAGTEIPHGFDVAHQIRELRPSALVYIWTAHAAEGELIRRASHPIRGRSLVDGVLSKHDSIGNLVKAVTTKLQVPQISLWIDTDLQPPPGCYSAIDKLTESERRNLRVLARRPGASREQLVDEIHIAPGTWASQLSAIKIKIHQEVTERASVGARTEIAVRSAPEQITAEDLTRWARARNLHWPFPDFEGSGA